MIETNYDETKVPAYTLPPLLKSQDGTEIKTAFDWVRKRRPEILQTLKMRFSESCLRDRTSSPKKLFP